MGEMSRRKKRRLAGLAEGRAEAKRRRNTDQPPIHDDDDEGMLEMSIDEVLIDQGDGMHVARCIGTRGFDDASNSDPPDEAPPGWCET